MLTLLVLGSQASLRGDAVMSRACTALEAHSLQPCDRCLSHDLCPVVDGVAWSCDWISKHCAHPSWVAGGNADEVGRRCNESDAVPSTWGAKCKKRCDEQIAPFSCAPGNCLNSDFPCRWVEGCMPPLGMFPMTVACLSSCVDYDELLNEMLGFETCYKAVETRGCDTGVYLKHERISDYCPLSCGSSQCQHRCSRDEVPSEDGKQCWQKVQHEKLLCGEAVRLGFDCHCVCGYDYLVASSSRKGGAFYKGERFAGVKLALEVAAVSRHPKTISLMGADMNKKSVSGPDGPRMKIVGENELCGIANIINNVMGIDCGRAADQLAGSVCDTPPSFATAFTHQWADVSFGDCGTFQICHCNQQCTERQNWRSIGTVVVEAAPLENEHAGGVLRSFPACEQDFDLSSFKTGTLGTVPLEKRVQTTITASLGISGGLQPLGSILHAIRATLVKIIAVESPMLGVTIPLEEDVMVRSLDGRRLEEEDDDRRLQSGCFDDDAVFAEMARKIGLALSSCTEVLSTVYTSELCGDPIIADAVWKGCRQTCGLCTYLPPTTVRTTRPPLLTTSTETTTTEDGNTTTTVVPTTTTTVTTWPGGPDVLRLAVEVGVNSDRGALHLEARLEALRADPVVFLRALHEELSKSFLRPGQHPDRLWLWVVEGPTRLSGADGGGGGGGNASQASGAAASAAAGPVSGEASAADSSGFPLSLSTTVLLAGAGGAAVLLLVAVLCCRRCCCPRGGAPLQHAGGASEEQKLKAQAEVAWAERRADGRPAPALEPDGAWQGGRRGCLRHLCCCCVGLWRCCFRCCCRRRSEVYADPFADEAPRTPAGKKAKKVAGPSAIAAAPGTAEKSYRKGNRQVVD